MLDKTYTPDTIGDCKTFYDVTLDDITKYEKDARKLFLIWSKNLR